jgi:hypothetical protein
MKKYLRRAVAGLSFAALSGCVRYTKPVDPAEKPTGDDAYLFGRFTIESPLVVTGRDGYQTMGFEVRCNSFVTGIRERPDRRYRLRFSRDEPLQVIRIGSGMCAMNDIFFTDANGMVQGHKVLPAELRSPRRFEAGHAYYLGDYTGRSTYTEYPKSKWAGSSSLLTWKLTRASHHFEDATRSLQIAYPGLATLSIEDRTPGVPQSTRAPLAQPGGVAARKP